MQAATSASCQHIEDCNQDGMTCIRTEIDEYRFTETCKNADNTIDRTFDRDSSSPTETCDTEGYHASQIDFVQATTCYNEKEGLIDITCLNTNNYVFIDPGVKFFCAFCPYSFTNQEDDDGTKCCTRMEIDEYGNVSNNCRPCDCWWEQPEEPFKQWWRLS